MPKIEGDGLRKGRRYKAKPAMAEGLYWVYVSIHARYRANGRGYASPNSHYPPKGGGFKPELVLDEIQEERRPSEVVRVAVPRELVRRLGAARSQGESLSAQVTRLLEEAIEKNTGSI